jgi:death on curing protein
MDLIRFLSLSDILLIHADQIRNYGGLAGVQDLSLLSSALAMPESSYEGNYLHKDIIEMAFAYAFHICQNHPFIDGNKRTALASALVFFDLNGEETDDPEGKLYEAMILVAGSKKGKSYLADVFRKLIIQ